MRIKVPRDAVSPFCKDCGKSLTNKKEVELHFLVCEKVPQEIFNGRGTSHIYFKTPFGGSSVSFGTNCSSSLTNPLLGAPSDK